MRLAPVPIRYANLFPGQLDELISYLMDSSRPTHASPQWLVRCSAPLAGPAIVAPRERIIANRRRIIFADNDCHRRLAVTFFAVVGPHEPKPPSLLPVDFRLGQRPLKLLDSGAGDLGAREVHDLQSGQSSEVHQAGVGDLRLR
jgi:hypothetical protein